jgi:hypothetical protein
MPNFKLRFNKKDIHKWSSLYDRESGSDTDEIPRKIGKKAKKNGCLSKDELFEICKWKSSRKANTVKSTSEKTIKEVTSFAFSTPDEHARIACLAALPGVGWPTASVIMHFCISDKYPILDFRAIWSLSEKKPNTYKFEFWWEYTETCRKIAKENKVSLRFLDKALWQYSSRYQRTGN